MVAERFSKGLVCLVILLCFGCQAQEEEKINDTKDNGLENKLRKELEEGLRNKTRKLDPFHLPFIPTLAFNPQPNFDISLSLTDVLFEGLSDQLFVDKLDLPSLFPFGSKECVVQLRFGNLNMRAGQYIAGGHVNNLPFTGESCARATLEDMSITLNMETKVNITNKSACITKNSTQWLMDIRKSVVLFDNLNPGTDQGQLVNTALSGFIPDLIDYLQSNFNDAWHLFFDDLIVNNLNTLLRCPDQEE